MIYSKAAFSLHTLTAGILLVVIIQTLIKTVRSILLSHFSFKTDLQLNFSYLSHIFSLPLSFFESRKSGEVLSRLGDLEKIKQTLSSAALSGVMDVVMLVVSGLISGISGILVYWIGCSAIIAGTMSFGTLITFNSLLGYFTGPLFRLINIQNQVQEALVAAERVGEILELEKEKNDTVQYMKPEKIEEHIKFEDVTFAYGSRRPVYEHLNLEIPGGSWAAFVGPSGSGKSTFVKLILKFYEANEGRIFLDGNDIRDINSSSTYNSNWM